MKRIDLPGGGWAEVREATDLKIRHKHMLGSASVNAARAIGKLEAQLPEDFPKDPKLRASALEALDVTPYLASGALDFDDAQALQKIQEITVVAFLAKWSLPDAIPTVATVGDMDEDIYEAIAQATKDDAARALGGIDFDPTPEDEPGNPTGRGDGSNGQSSAKPDSPSTPRSSRSTPSTASVT